MTTEARKVTPGGDTPRRHADALNQHAEFLNTGQLQERTVAQLAAETAVLGRQYICTDETGGIVPVFGDGSDWRRVTDRAVAS